MTTPTLILVVSESEQGYELYEMDHDDALECKRLLKKAAKTGEWPDEVTEILDRSTRIKPFGVINTMGDGWGWYKA